MTPVATMDDVTARASVLSAADRVFYERGVTGTGMAEIRDASGVSLRRLYGLHPSKAELVAAWLTDRHRTWMAWFEAAVEEQSATGVEPLLAAFDAIASWSRTPGYRGCAFLNTAAEITEIDERHRAIIASHKRGLIAYLAALARDREFRSPDQLAEMLAVLIDGAIVQATVLSSTEPVGAARAAASRLLEVSR